MRSVWGVEDKCVQGYGEECEGRRPLVRHRQRWVDNIKMDLKEIELEVQGLDSSGCGVQPVAGFCEYGNECMGGRRQMCTGLW
jgi:hypothetical protein